MSLKKDVYRKINVRIAVFSSVVYFGFLCRRFFITNLLFSFGTERPNLGDILLLILYGALLFLNWVNYFTWKENNIKITFVLWGLLSCWLLYYTFNKSMFPFFIR